VATGGVNWIKIGDVALGAKFVTNSAEQITAKGAEKSRHVKKGDFILSNSMSFGRPYILAIDGCVHDGWIVISDYKDSVTSDYLYHVLNTSFVQNYWKQRASQGGSIQNLNSDIVRETLIPVPLLDEQEHIASILDKFDALTTGITVGLPAEIEARRKQYEYYRDKLLTFKEKVM
jgi:type I restriction enzyme S subunit